MYKNQGEKSRNMYKNQGEKPDKMHKNQGQPSIFLFQTKNDSTPKLEKVIFLAEYQKLMPKVLVEFQHRVFFCFLHSINSDTPR